MSTWMLASFSYLCTPAAAIFQNSLVLLVTNASFSEPGLALKIFTSPAASLLDPVPELELELSRLHEPPSSAAAKVSVMQNQFRPIVHDFIVFPRDSIAAAHRTGLLCACRMCSRQ